MKKYLYLLRAWVPYIIPSIFVIIYLIITFKLRLQGNNNDWYARTNGFIELCKSLVGFTTVILGIYGVVVPIAVGKMNDEVGKVFWSLIDRDRFINDVKRIIISGILNILFCSLLLIYDILPNGVITCFICIVIWTLLFFMFSSYRFISIFMSLISSNKKTDLVVQDDLSEEEKASLNKIPKL